jgi:hypothetical protein
MTAHTAITIYGVVAVTFMMTMYAAERRHPAFVLAFAAGCLASAGYGFLAGAWPFGVVETVWSVIAVRRYLSLPERRGRAAAPAAATPAAQASGSRREAP